MAMAFVDVRVVLVVTAVQDWESSLFEVNRYKRRQERK